MSNGPLLREVVLHVYCSLFDTMEERFHKLKSLAKHFLICQIGMVTP